jgi:hypothetical protein
MYFAVKSILTHNRTDVLRSHRLQILSGNHLELALIRVVVIPFSFVQLNTNLEIK